MHSRMKYFVLLTTSVAAITTATQGTASAQILTTARCQNAFGVPQDTAQRRMAWGEYCRVHPEPDANGVPRPGTVYLTNESVTDYNTADPTMKAALFPTYFDQNTFAVWDVPNAQLTPNTVPSGTPPTNPAACLVLPQSAVNAGLCVAGCYVAGTALQFADGPIAIGAAQQASQGNLVTLAPDATLDNLTTITNKVDRYTKDLVDTVQVIYTLTMASGGQLRVTNEHPLLGPDGIIRQAQMLKVGDALVRANGKPDPIVSIRTGKENTKVYNVRPVTTDYTSNIVIAEGYLNGSLRYQNEFLDTINSLILRRAFEDQADKLTN